MFEYVLFLQHKESRQYKENLYYEIQRFFSVKT